MRKAIQTFMKNAGENGCYALCIIHLAELISGEHQDIIRDLEEGIARGFIFYNNMLEHDNENFYMKDPASFLSFLINRRVTVKKVGAEYYPAPNEYAVNCWEWKKFTHFTLDNWDTLFNSNTVKYGKITSKRIFTVY